MHESKYGHDERSSSSMSSTHTTFRNFTGGSDRSNKYSSNTSRWSSWFPSNPDSHPAHAAGQEGGNRNGESGASSQSFSDTRTTIRMIFSRLLDKYEINKLSRAGFKRLLYTVGHLKKQKHNFIMDRILQVMRNKHNLSQLALEFQDFSNIILVLLFERDKRLLFSFLVFDLTEEGEGDPDNPDVLTNPVPTLIALIRNIECYICICTSQLLKTSLSFSRSSL